MFGMCRLAYCQICGDGLLSSIEYRNTQKVYILCILKYTEEYARKCIDFVVYSSYHNYGIEDDTEKEVQQKDIRCLVSPYVN